MRTVAWGLLIYHIACEQFISHICLPSFHPSKASLYKERSKVSPYFFAQIINGLSWVGKLPELLFVQAVCVPGLFVLRAQLLIKAEGWIDFYNRQRNCFRVLCSCQNCLKDLGADARFRHTLPCKVN